jgi:MFS family permease
LGGLLVEGLGWRSVFFINLPIAALGVATALVILDSKQLSQARANGERSSFDWAGAGLSAGALVTFLMAVTNGHRWGWGSPAVVGGFMGAGALLALFLWRETCTSSPMLDLDLFKRRVFSLGALAAFTAFLSTASIFFLMPFYLQKILGYSPGQAGLILVASSACMATTGPIAGRLSDRFGWRVFTVGGAAVSAVSMFLVSQLSEDSTLALVVPALILHGVGGGMFHAANHSSVLGAVEPSRYGVASAFIHLNRNTASTTGLAIAIAIVVTTMGSMGFEPSLDAVTGGAGGGVAHAFTVGLRRVYYMTGGILIAVMIMSLFQGKRTRVLPEAKAGVPQVANGVKEAARGTPD